MQKFTEAYVKGLAARVENMEADAFIIEGDQADVLYILADYASLRESNFNTVQHLKARGESLKQLQECQRKLKAENTTLSTKLEKVKERTAELV